MSLNEESVRHDKGSFSRTELDTVDSRLHDFYGFIYARQKIWYDRFVLKKPYPWTEDEVLKTYKFCNVYRENDKGTQYIINVMMDIVKVDTNFADDKNHALFNDIAYRIFNKYGMFEWIGQYDYLDFDNEWKLIEEHMDEELKNGETVFNDAYMICGIPVDYSYRPESKHVQVLLMLKDLAKRIDRLRKDIEWAKNPEEVMKLLEGIHYIGPFLAYEIWCDLSYVKLIRWTDNDFVNMGPGAKWGIRIIYGGEKSDYKEEDYVRICKQLRDTQEKMFIKYQIPFINVAYTQGYSNRPYLSLRNIEHVLCEYRKYTRLSEGEGKRRRYVPP